MGLYDVSNSVTYTVFLQNIEAENEAEAKAKAEATLNSWRYIPTRDEDGVKVINDDWDFNVNEAYEAEARILRERQEEVEEANHFDKWRQAANAIEDRMRKAIEAVGEKCRITFSAYDNDDNDIPVDNLDRVAVEGKVILFQEASDYWGGAASENYESEILENPTWMDVAIRANRMVKQVADLHHIFLEAVYLDKKRTAARTDGVKVYNFSMGS